MNDQVEEIKKKSCGGRIVFVSGNFNVVHPGHLRLLKFAVECGDFMVVGVTDKTSYGAKLPEEMRLEGVRAISLVKYAFLLTEPPEQFIARLKPEVVVKGKEYETRDNAEQAVIESYGGKLLFGSGEVRFSSMDLLQQEYFESNYSAIRKPTEYLARHGFGLYDLKRHLTKISGLKVLVLGDLIIDEYINCEPLGMSQEDPTIVVAPLESKRFVGGAGIVAAHAKGLGADVQYLTIAGPDEAGFFAKQKLDEYGVRSTIIPDDSRPTTLKQRFRAGSKTLLRVSHLRQHEARPEIAGKIQAVAERALGNVDLVIFADFNYGCLPQGLVDQMVRLCRERGVPMVADSQASSQVSDVSRFQGMRLVTPTEREARLALQDWNSGLVVIAEKLRQKSHAENVIVTLGAEGVLIHAVGAVESDTDRLPAFNTAPKDPAGAGDSFLTCASMALCTGVDIWQSAYLGALAAAFQVSRVGNTPLTQAELIAEIDYV